MDEKMLSDAAILESWHANAAAWTRAVREQAIASRRLVTDRAILDAITCRAPASVLDVGCGEGWLARALQATGVVVVGVDAVPQLIESARRAGPGDFRICAYENLARAGLSGPFDIVVANFSLLGSESVGCVFRAAAALLAPGGSFIVQTLHPVVASREQAYEDGWRGGSWAGFGPDFVDPPPWYFRTIGSWIRLFVNANYRLTDVREPIDRRTGEPVSLILCATR